MKRQKPQCSELRPITNASQDELENADQASVHKGKEAAALRPPQYWVLPTLAGALEEERIGAALSPCMLVAGTGAQDLLDHANHLFAGAIW
jgi:hypothetical protein